MISSDDYGGSASAAAAPESKVFYKRSSGAVKAPRAAPICQTTGAAWLPDRRSHTGPSPRLRGPWTSRGGKKNLSQGGWSARNWRKPGKNARGTPRSTTRSSTIRSTRWRANRCRRSRSTSTRPATANVRRFLIRTCSRPRTPCASRRLLNYFPYNDPPPPDSSPAPVRGARRDRRLPLERPAPAGADRHRGQADRPVEAAAQQPGLPGRRSGSMQAPNKLPLVQWSLQRLVEQLGENDQVAIVVYAGASGLVLPSTSCIHKAEILSAIDQLQAGGSTNGGAGIQLAYDVATQHFIKNGTNRVILATDGDFNVGVTERGRSDPADRGQGQERRLPQRPGLRHGQHQGRQPGTARRQGQRPLRLHRLAARGVQGAGRGDGLDPGHGRQGREDPGRVQPGQGRRHFD